MTRPFLQIKFHAEAQQHTRCKPAALLTCHGWGWQLGVGWQLGMIVGGPGRTTWSLSRVFNYSPTPCPPSGLWRDPSRCAEKLCLDKEMPLSCSSFTPSKEKCLMAKWLSFFSWIWNFCNQAGLLPSVQMWRWRLLRMHLLPRVFAPTSFQVSKPNHFYGLLW